jgi:hypothetical protein
MSKTLFFRSGRDPLILTEEKRELRKQQRIEELRNNTGMMLIRSESNVPELGRNNQVDIFKLFQRKVNNQDFFSLNREANKQDSKKANKNKKSATHVADEPNFESNVVDSDCAICMDKPRNSVLRPCAHCITCYDCSMLLLNRQDNCPVCREKIDEVIKIFMS